MRSWKAPLKDYPLNIYLAGLGQLRNNGFSMEADSEFDKLVTESFSGEDPPDIGPYLTWACGALKDESRAFYFADRITALRERDGNEADILSALHSKYDMLVKAQRYKEATDLMVAAVHRNYSRTIADWDRRSSCLWVATISLLSNYDLAAARRLVEEFNPPANLMSPACKNMLDWCRLFILSNEGKDAECQTLRAKLEPYAKGKDQKAEHQLWFKYSEVDLLLAQNNFTEAWKVLCRARPVVTADYWTANRFCASRSNKVKELANAARKKPQ